MLQNYISSHLRVVEKAFGDETLRQSWEVAFRKMCYSLKEGNVIYVAGNGGSAADSQHFAAELIGRFRRERHSLPAVALTTDTSILTAIGNDYGFDHVFSRQVEGLVITGDVFVGISTSGNSQNIINAVSTAKLQGAETVTLLGGDGGKLKGMADVELIVHSRETSHIQEVHQLIYHSWCLSLEEALA